MTAKQKKKPTVSFIDGIALRTLKPGKLYSARVRMDPDVQFGGEHETWYWSKSRKIEAPSKAKALEKAERYRKELVDGVGGTDLTVAEFAREWQDGREEQSRASLESTGIAKPSPRTIERDEMEIRRIEERFAKVKVRDLTPGGIERVIAEMRTEGISENTIFKMVKKLRHVLSRPVQRGYLDRNPCDLVEGISEPKVNPVTKAHRRIRADAVVGEAGMRRVLVLDRTSMLSIAKEMRAWGRHYNQAVHALNIVARYLRGRGDADEAEIADALLSARAKLDDVEDGRRRIEARLDELCCLGAIRGR